MVTPDNDPRSLLAHAQDLRRLARALTRDEDAADELVQDAWVEILEGRADPRLARERGGWTAGLLHNLRRERARREVRLTRREQRAARRESVEDGPAMLERLELFRELAAEVARLEEPYRSSIWQHYFEGRTAEEIANSEGVSPSTVRSRWMRALARLRERLDQRYRGDRAAWLTAFAPLSAVAPVRRTAGRAARLFAVVAIGLFVIGTVWFATSRQGAREDARSPAMAEAGSSGGVELASGGRGETSSIAREPAPRTVERAQAAVASGGALLHLHVVDVRTGEDVPACWLRIRAGDDEFEACTDERGWLLADAAALGELSIEVLDDPASPPGPLPEEGRAFRRARALVHDGRGELELRVPVGPSFEFELEGMEVPDPHEIEARLVAASGALARAIAVARVRAAVPEQGWRHAWVRFGPDALALRGGGPWTLELRTADGLRGGSATVEAGAGRAAALVPVRLEPRCSLRLRVRDERGTPCSAQIELSDASGVLVAQADAPAGELRLDGLRRGPHRLSVLVPGLPAGSRLLDLEPREQELEMVIPRAAVRGAVEGRVHIEAGGAWPIEVSLRDARGCELRMSVLAGGTGRASTPFRFDEVPAGRYELSARSRGAWSWSPAALEIVAPAEGLELRALTHPDGLPLIVKARDGRTGAPIEHFDARVVFDGAALERGTSIGAVTFPGLPRSARVAWCVVAPGWMPKHGDERAVRIDGERMSLVVDLESGFALRVRVIDEESDAPLAGAAVLADGISRGVTDARGEFLLRGPTAARRITAALEGWRAVGGDVDPQSGAWLPRELDLLVLRLAPAR